MFRIPHIRAVIDDKRVTQSQIKALLAKTSLPGNKERRRKCLFRRRYVERWQHQGRCRQCR